jgi:hypothetical protein
MTGKRLVVMSNLSELMSMNDSQEVIIFVNKLTHGATCFCQYERLNMKVIDVVDDLVTSCSALRRIINLRQPVSCIFETISRVINSNHHRTACQLCHVLSELTPEEKMLIKIIREVSTRQRRWRQKWVSVIKLSVNTKGKLWIK